MLPKLSQRYITLQLQEYLPAARAEPGISSLSGGKEFYQQCLNWHLTTKMTPEEVHNLGLAEVARITVLMENVIINKLLCAINNYLIHNVALIDLMFCFIDN